MPSIPLRQLRESVGEIDGVSEVDVRHATPAARPTDSRGQPRVRFTTASSSSGERAAAAHLFRVRAAARPAQVLRARALRVEAPLGPARRAGAPRAAARTAAARTAAARTAREGRRRAPPRGNPLRAVRDAAALRSVGHPTSPRRSPRDPGLRSRGSGSHPRPSPDAQAGLSIMLHGRKFGVTFSIVVSIAAVRRRRSNRRAARERRHRDATAAPPPGRAP